MTTAVALNNGNGAALARDGGFTREQVDLIKRTVADGASDDELALFLEVCKSTGLNPFQRQIYAVMRKSKTKRGREWVEEQKMVIQTGIDGYRLIAARSGVHAGTSDAEYGPENKDGYPEWARVTVRKVMPGGVIADFTATARWKEYCQTKDEYQGGEKTGRQVPSGQWPKMPFLMLGKCAEALALRKAFPAELSGVYTNEEMAQADSTATAPPSTRDPEELTIPSERRPCKAEQARIFKVASEKGLKPDDVLTLLRDNNLPTVTAELSREQYTRLCDVLIPAAAAVQTIDAEAELMPWPEEDPLEAAVRGATPADVPFDEEVI